MFEITKEIIISRKSKDRQHNDQMFASTKGVIRSRNSKRDRQRNYQTFEDTKEVIISRKSKDRKHNGQMLENIKGVIRNRKSKRDRQRNTVVSNHFHSVKILLFSSARSRDFDAMLSAQLPVSMYTTKIPIDMCRFNVRSSTLKNLNIFCERQISIKLFYLYQRFQLVFFLYLRLSASSKENDLPICIYFWYQTDSGVLNTSIYSAVSLASIYCIYDYDMLTLSQ
jgi:hypothetical protein